MLCGTDDGSVFVRHISRIEGTGDITARLLSIAAPSAAATTPTKVTTMWYEPVPDLLFTGESHESHDSASHMSHLSRDHAVQPSPRCHLNAHSTWNPHLFAPLPSPLPSCPRLCRSLFTPRLAHALVSPFPFSPLCLLHLQAT